MNLNTSFTGDDNLYVRLKTGNHTGNFGEITLYLKHMELTYGSKTKI